MKLFFCICLAFFLLFSKQSGYAQTVENSLDSLKHALNKSISDTEQINILLELTSSAPCSDSAEKIAYANKAAELAGKMNWNIGLVRVYLSIGNVYFGCTNNYPRAVAYFLMADSCAQSIQDKTDEAVALSYTAIAYQKNGRFGNAINYYRKLISLSPGADQEMGAWGNMGVEYNNIGDYNQALNCYYHSLKILNDLGKKSSDQQDTAQMAGLLLNIGDVYMELSLPEKAFENYDSVYKLGTTIQNQPLQLVGAMGMGEVYYTQKNYDRSIGCYQSALNISTTLNDQSAQVKTLNKLALANLGKKDFGKAMEYAQSAMKLALDKAENEQLPQVYITIGKVYTQQKDYEHASAYLQKALDIARQTNARNDEKDAWYALVGAYKQMNQPANALDAYEHYITIRDSVYNIAKANEITRQELDYNYKSQELAHKLNFEKKLARQQLFIYFGFAVIALLLLLAFFIYRNYKTQKKYNELLHREKKRHLAHIEEQDTVLMDIANIQSHRVRGPVATILGLVQIFNYNDLADPINKEVMEGLGKITEKLDVAVKEVIQRENQSRSDQRDIENA